jgi:hypothetical protein
MSHGACDMGGWGARVRKVTSAIEAGDGGAGSETAEDLADERAKRGDPRPIRRDSQSAIAVLSAAAFSQALVGDAIWRSVGADETRREQLVTWLAELLESRELGGSRRA